MNYNSHQSVAVFLGPSLEQSAAARILGANYYPPARMGDIYRLLGSSVQIIVLIDGVFHQTASTWQRELLEALDNAIQVIGASSMGALRAAELYRYGMIGQGTIFEWYRDGVIESDDEVALNHADEALGFRPFSEPLVNIRYNLWQAVQRNIISPEQGAELIEFARRTYYAERSYEALLQSLSAKKWPAETQERLTYFICQKAVNLKKQDAIGALRYCAALIKQSHQGPPSPLLPRHQGRYYGLVRSRYRGFLHEKGYLLSGKTLLSAALQDVELIKSLRPVLIKNYFLGLWAKQRQLKCPPDYLLAFKRRWEEGYIQAFEHVKVHFDTPQQPFSTESLWLRANGLTKPEFQAELEQRALLTWLVEQGPTAFGLDFEPYIQFVESLSAQDVLGVNKASSEGLSNRIELLTQAAEICYLAAWARENGIACSPAIIEKFIEKWEELHQISHRVTWLKLHNLPEAIYLAVLTEWAGAAWLIEKSPLYFGYTSWSFEVALLKELQMTGQAARIIEIL